MRTLSTELEPPFLPASQAPQGRAVVVSQQPRVPFSPTPDILLADMESPSRVEHGEQVRRQTVALNATYWVLFWIVCARFRTWRTPLRDGGGFVLTEAALRRLQA